MWTFLSCIYAGIHASAWNGHFPSYPERWIWRGSCICIAGGMLLFMMISFPARWINSIDDSIVHNIYKSRRAEGFSVWRPFRWVTVACMWFCIGCHLLISTLYVSARIFIVVEAFISVRSLPLGAFDTVEWLSFWPHI